VVRDSRYGFGWLSIALHWINAVAIFCLLYFGVKLAYYQIFSRPPPNFNSWLEWHISIGVVAAPFLLWRIVRRFAIGKPKTNSQAGFLQWTADAVWRLLMIGVVVQMITGPLWYWYLGHGLPVFGLWEIPTPFPLGDQPQIQAAGSAPRHSAEAIRRHGSLLSTSLQTIHLAVACGIVLLLVLHVAGALKHAVVDRDGVFLGMIRPKRPEAS